jgi:hypothetical protein
VGTALQPQQSTQQGFDPEAFRRTLRGEPEPTPGEAGEPGFLARLRAMVGAWGKTWGEIVGQAVSPLPPGQALPGGAQPTKLTRQEQQDALTASGLAAGFVVAPALMAAVGVSATAARVAARPKEGVRRAAVGALESGFGLGEPVAQVAENVGLEGTAALVRRHPFLSELVLQFGHDVGVLRAQRSLMRALDPLANLNLQPVVREALAGLPYESSPALVAAEERALQNVALRTTLVEQLDALRIQRTSEHATLQQGEALRQTAPQGFEVTGTRATPAVPDRPSIWEQVHPQAETRLASQRATTMDHVAAQIEREAEAAVELAASPAAMRSLAETGFFDPPRAGVALPAGEAGRLPTVEIIKQARKLVAPEEFERRVNVEAARRATGQPLQPLEQAAVVEQVAREVVAEGRPRALLPRQATPPAARAGQAGSPFAQTAEEAGATTAALTERASLTERIQVLTKAGIGQKEAVRLAEQGTPVLRQQAERLAAELDAAGGGDASKLLAGIIDDLKRLGERGAASPQLLGKILVQGGFVTSGAWLAGSDDEYLSTTGWTLIALGAGSAMGPAIGRASKTAARAFIGGPATRLLGEDDALAFARWFAPEYGMAKELVEARRMTRALNARGQALAADLAQRSRKIAQAAGRTVAQTGRAAGASRAEARQLGRQEASATQQRLLVEARRQQEAGPALALPDLPPALQDEALRVIDDFVRGFEDVGKMQDELNRFLQGTLDMPATSYIPRFMLDTERSLFGLDPSPPFSPPVRRTGMRIQRDRLPHYVEEDELAQIQRLDYTALRGFSRAFHNVSVETAFRTLRELDRVWPDYDNVALAMRQVERAQAAARLAGARGRQLSPFKRRLEALEERLSELDAAPPEGFRKLPTSAGLGSLRGRWVDTESWRFLRDYERVSTPKRAVVTWNGLMDAWRFTMTALNIPTHLGNIGSNFVLAFINGGLPWWRADVYRAAWRDYVARGPLYRELRDQGILGRTFIAQETRQALGEFTDAVRFDARRLLLDIATTEAPRGIGLRDGVRVVERFLKGAGQVYGAEEELFKIAVYAYRKSAGDAPQDAARLANEAILDYSQRSGFINFTRAAFIPFFTFSAKAAPVLARNIVDHPERLPLALAPLIALDLIARNVVGVPAVQPYNTQKRGAFDIRYTLMPIVTEDGDAVYLNTGRFTPLGPFVTGSPVETILPKWWPAALTPSHPLIAWSTLFMARDPLSGDPLFTDLQTSPEKAMIAAGEALATVTPSMISRNLTRALKASGTEALIEAAGVLGARPVIVEQTGIPERRHAVVRVREARADALRRLRRQLRAAETPADTAAVRERALRYNLRLLELVNELRQGLPQIPQQQ